MRQEVLRTRFQGLLSVVWHTCTLPLTVSYTGGTSPSQHYDQDSRSPLVLLHSSLLPAWQARIRAGCLQAAPCLLREGQMHLCRLVVVAEGKRRGLGGQRGCAEEAAALRGVGEEVDHQRPALIDDPKAADACAVITHLGEKCWRTLVRVQSGHQLLLWGFGACVR